MSTQSKKKYKVFVNNKGQIETHYLGDQTAESIAEILEQYDNFRETILKEKKRYDYILNVSQLGHATYGARKAAFDCVSSLKLRKLAVYGGTGSAKSLANLILRALNKRKTMQYFETREQAESWLDI